MNRQLWLTGLSKTYCPPWPCPTCKVGHLRLRQKSYTHVQTVESHRWHNRDDLGPENIEFTFNAWADCSNEHCKEQFSVVGNGGIEQQYTCDDDGSTEWVNHYYPKWIEPSLLMIEIPPKCPRSVSDPLCDAFSLYWSQPDACASRIRVALEALLTHLGVPEEEIFSNGKASALSLHRRIELFKMQNLVVGNQLMALKWLGNTGSHGGSVTKTDLIDGLELLEHSLVELLEKRSEKMAALEKGLLVRHGPNAP